MQNKASNKLIVEAKRLSPVRGRAIYFKSLNDPLPGWVWDASFTNNNASTYTLEWLQAIKHDCCNISSTAHLNLFTKMNYFHIKIQLKDSQTNEPELQLFSTNKPIPFLIAFPGLITSVTNFLTACLSPPWIIHANFIDSNTMGLHRHLTEVGIYMYLTPLTNSQKKTRKQILLQSRGSSGLVKRVILWRWRQWRSWDCCMIRWSSKLG